MRKGVCTNFGNCKVADSKQIIQIPQGADFLCPACTRHLTEVNGKKQQPFALVAALIVLGLGLWWFFKKPVTGDHPPPPPPASSTRVDLRLHGSNTIGAQLAPELAAEFLRSRGARNVTVIPGPADEFRVQGNIGNELQSIEIKAHGSSTAFEDLGTDRCDIGMASRPIKPDEARALARLGDMRSPANEHVLGVDGIAILVNKANSVQSLTKEQLSRIFTGAISNWSELGGSAGAINVYARNNASGTYDTFKSLVLGPGTLVSSAKRLEDSRELSDRVADDLNGIGFTGLPYVRSTRAMAISENGTRPLVPNRLTVSTEDYLLSRRLFLYTPASPTAPLTRAFIDFALSKAGQDVVDKIGFIGLNVVAVETKLSADAPMGYRSLLSGAQRLSLDFRFRTASKELDNKARVDIDRVVSILTDLKYNGSNVLLLGFADSRGTRPMNQLLSEDRARAVSEQFQMRGITPSMVRGFGPDMPVGSNETEEGRERNRRVEIWVKK